MIPKTQNHGSVHADGGASARLENCAWSTWKSLEKYKTEYDAFDFCHYCTLKSNHIVFRAPSMGRVYKNTVLARAHYWTKMKHPLDIRAYSTNLDETQQGILVQLAEMLPAKWFIAAFGGQGLKIEQFKYEPVNYVMKDVMGIAKPATGVQRFMSDGWKHSGTTMSRACFDWMKGGCARGDRCSYNHVPAQHKCLRNIHEPTRVKSKPRKHDHTKYLICGRGN